MTYDERMCKCCSNLIKEQSRKIISEIAEITLRDLRRVKRRSGMMMSASDSGLDNLWDEICVQMQSDYSIYWDAYVDYMEIRIQSILKSNCTENEIRMIWLQSDQFLNWSDCEFEDEDDLAEYFNSDGFPIEYQIEDVIGVIMEKVLSLAENYTNARIEKYLY